MTAPGGRPPETPTPPTSPEEQQQPELDPLLSANVGLYHVGVTDRPDYARLPQTEDPPPLVATSGVPEIDDRLVNVIPHPTERQRQAEQREPMPRSAARADRVPRANTHIATTVTSRDSVCMATGERSNALQLVGVQQSDGSILETYLINDAKVATANDARAARVATSTLADFMNSHKFDGLSPEDAQSLMAEAATAADESVRAANEEAVRQAFGVIDPDQPPKDPAAAAGTMTLLSQQLSGRTNAAVVRTFRNDEGKTCLAALGIGNVQAYVIRGDSVVPILRPQIYQDGTPDNTLDGGNYSNRSRDQIQIVTGTEPGDRVVLVESGMIDQNGHLIEPGHIIGTAQDNPGDPQAAAEKIAELAFHPEGEEEPANMRDVEVVVMDLVPRGSRFKRAARWLLGGAARRIGEKRRAKQTTEALTEALREQETQTRTAAQRRGNVAAAAVGAYSEGREEARRQAEEKARERTRAAIKGIDRINAANDALHPYDIAGSIMRIDENNRRAQTAARRRNAARVAGRITTTLAISGAALLDARLGYNFALGSGEMLDNNALIIGTVALNALGVPLGIRSGRRLVSRIANRRR